jgi:site-specific recombinase XerD
VSKGLREVPKKKLTKLMFSYNFSQRDKEEDMKNEMRKYDVREVTSEDIKAYMDYLTIKKGNSVVTRARKLAAVKSFFKYLMENGELDVNVSASVSSPRIPEKEPEYLTEEECIRA